MEAVPVRKTFRLIGMLAALAFAMPAIGADDLAAYLAAVSSKLDPRAAEALVRLDGTGRQLLAARSYLRSGESLSERWSWSQQQIDDYQGSPAQAQLDAEITRVRLEFELENPGFTLFVNPGVRSLDVQIEHWNSNASVAEAAEELLLAANAFLVSGTIAEANTPVGRDAFANFLLAHTPLPAPTIAAPGLSPHGQMRAVDFHIETAGQTVAGPDTQTIESVWLAEGWRNKLSAAVIASGAEFVGPLEKPDEPWHYSYYGALEP